MMEVIIVYKVSAFGKTKLLKFMGEWNSLHLFDDKKFYGKLVPILKNDKEKVRDYFLSNSGVNSVIEDPDVFTDERVEKVVEISNNLIESFRVYPKYAKSLDNCINREEKQKVRRQISREVEDFNGLLLTAVFKECALVKSYFMLGYRRVTSNLKYKTKESEVEQLFLKLMYQQKETTIISLGMGSGIRNWLTNHEVKKILDSYDKDVASDQKNTFSLKFVKGLKEFLKLADQHELGVLACLDIDINELSKDSYEISGIDWSEVENIAIE